MSDAWHGYNYNHFQFITLQEMLYKCCTVCVHFVLFIWIFICGKNHRNLAEPDRIMHVQSTVVVILKPVLSWWHLWSFRQLTRPDQRTLHWITTCSTLCRAGLQYSRAPKKSSIAPADLHFCLHAFNRAVMKSVQCTSFVSRKHHTTMTFQICSYNSNFQPSMF